MQKDYLLYDDGLILANKREESQYHEVSEGESLRDIARHYYGDADMWETIMRYNGLTSPDVLEGTELEIPPI